MAMFEQIRADFEVHDRSLRNRGLWALAVYRFGRWGLARRSALGRWLSGKLYGLGTMFSEIVTGVTMDRNVQVGAGFHIIHTPTVFIHPDVVIGERCGVMHNVTIGTNMDRQVPVIGNDVFIGCGASVLGGIRIGDNVRIAANSLVINDVPADSFAAGVPARSFKRLTTGLRTTAQRPHDAPPEAANPPEPG